MKMSGLQLPAYLPTASKILCIAAANYSVLSASGFAPVFARMHASNELAYGACSG